MAQKPLLNQAIYLLKSSIRLQRYINNTSCHAIEPVWMIWMRIFIAHRKKYSIFAKNKVFKQTIWIHKNHTS